MINSWGLDTALMSVPQFPDRMVDAGGHRLHAHVSGEGTPTVIFDAALGASLLSWVLVQPEIARVTRTVSYDRAGLGFSEPGPVPRTVSRIRAELEMLLDALEVKGPLVLVGHSFGALVARHYAAAHRNRVVGMILVDPALPDDWIDPVPQKRRRMELGSKFARRGAVAAKLGIARVVSALISLGAAGIARANVRAMTGRRVKAAGGFGAMPLVIVSAEGNADAQMAAEAARLSSAGSHVVVKNTGHWIQLDQPGAVVDAVLKVLRH